MNKRLFDDLIRHILKSSSKFTVSTNLNLLLLERLTVEQKQWLENLLFGGNSSHEELNNVENDSVDEYYVNKEFRNNNCVKKESQTEYLASKKLENKNRLKKKSQTEYPLIKKLQNKNCVNKESQNKNRVNKEFQNKYPRYFSKSHLRNNRRKEYDKSLISTILQVRIENGVKLKESLIICGRLNNPQIDGKCAILDKRSIKEPVSVSQSQGFSQSQSLPVNNTESQIKKNLLISNSQPTNSLEKMMKNFIRKSLIVLDPRKSPIKPNYQLAVLIKISQLRKDVRFRTCALVLAKLYKIDLIYDVIAQ